MRVPQQISSAARARRALLVDVVAAAFAAALVFHFAAGLGVIAFLGLPVLLIGLVWIVAERLLA